jgi:hypothetical protein
VVLVSAQVGQAVLGPLAPWANMLPLVGVAVLQEWAQDFTRPMQVQVRAVAAVQTVQLTRFKAR